MEYNQVLLSSLLMYALSSSLWSCDILMVRFGFRLIGMKDTRRPVLFHALQWMLSESSAEELGTQALLTMSYCLFSSEFLGIWLPPKLSIDLGFRMSRTKWSSFYHFFLLIPNRTKRAKKFSVYHPDNLKILLNGLLQSLQFIEV